MPHSYSKPSRKDEGMGHHSSMPRAEEKIFSVYHINIRNISRPEILVYHINIINIISEL